MAIKIEMLRCFATVAQSGSLAEAARRLGRTQSAVSMTLKQVEAQLGQRLFESDRKNRLTPLGQQVYELAQGQVRQFDNTVKAIETAARSPRGLVRIASIPSVAGGVFPSVIQTLTHRHPGLSVQLRDTDSTQVIDALMNGHADIGVVSGCPRLSGIRQARLFSDRFGMIAAPDHPLALQQDAPTVSQVAGDGFIFNALCSLIGDADARVAFEASRVSVYNTMSLVAMVRTGNWVTVLTKMVVQTMAPDLAFRPIADLGEDRPVSVLMRDRAPFPEFAEELWQMLTGFDWRRVVDGQGG